MSKVIIDWETHFYTQKLFTYLKARTACPYYKYSQEYNSYRMHYRPSVEVSHGNKLLKDLLNIEDYRLAQMDEVGIDKQVLSLSEPGVEWLLDDSGKAMEIIKDANNNLANSINKNPDRFLGFAALAPQSPDESARELERCVSEFGFVGWLTHSNFGLNKYLDDPCYRPILQVCHEQDIPIYLHPTIPEMEPFYKYGFSSAGASLGFQFSTGLCYMRMILGGVFDEFPKLKIMLGHLGETIPFLMERLDFTYDREWFDKRDRPNIKRKPSEILKENTYITVSGRYYEPALKYVIEAMGEDRVLFASDFPYESMPRIMNFIQSSTISSQEKDKLLYENSKQILK